MPRQALVPAAMHRSTHQASAKHCAHTLDGVAGIQMRQQSAPAEVRANSKYVENEDAKSMRIYQEPQQLRPQEQVAAGRQPPHRRQRVVQNHVQQLVVTLQQTCLCGASGDVACAPCHSWCNSRQPQGRSCTPDSRHLHDCLDVFCAGCSLQWSDTGLLQGRQQTWLFGR